MKTIKRHTRPINDCDIQNGIIDVLGMNYSGNQLVSVSEGATLMPEMGYAMGEHDGGYAYDANGNMTTIGNNSISLAYNFLNLPGGKGSESDDGVTTPAWTYSADGVKLKYENKDYVAGIEYKDGELYCIHHAEGRIFPKEQTPAEQASNAPLVWDYNFYLRDHLGNTRIVTNGFGIPVQENNYYPFGMNMDNIDAISDNTDRDSRYTYNGKEMNADLGVYDYGARFYDPSICRFIQVDPLADFPTLISTSPYNYVLNNPVLNIDPDGRKVINGHSGDLANDKKNLEKAQTTFDNTSKKKDGKKAFRTAKKDLRKAKSKFNSTQSKFNRTQSKIEAVQTGDSELFEAIDNLEDEGGNKVDVYVYDIVPDDLQEGRYADGTIVLGDTDAAAGMFITKSATGKSYQTVTSKRHPGNVTIRMGSNSTTKHLAHEFGHAIYNTRNMKAYVEWLRRNPKEQGKGGHGKGDPSGAAAHKAEENF